MTLLTYLCFLLNSYIHQKVFYNPGENYTSCTHPQASSKVTSLPCWNFRLQELFVTILEPIDTKTPIKTLRFKYQHLKLLRGTSGQSRQGINTTPQGFKRRFRYKDLQTLSDDITSPGIDAKKGEKFTM